MPVAATFGIDPVHLGVITALNLEIGLPFIALMLFVLDLVSFVPWLSLALL